MRPKLGGVLETALYVDDVERSARFYRELFNFETLEEDQRFGALNVAGKQVLLLFRKGGTTTPIVLPGGVIPPHDGTGTTHFAFSIPAADWDYWEQRLQGSIESVVQWPRGGRSLYFRDPDGHLVELATPGIWAIW